MDLELTEGGRRIFEEDCEEAFEPVDYNELGDIAADLGLSRSTGTRLYNCLWMEVCRWPLKDADGKIIYGIIDLQALLFYEALDKFDESTFKLEHSRSWINFPRSFGTKCLKVLEAYLVQKGLIEDYACEVYSPTNT